MEKLHVPKSEALRALFWRDEILQVMYWIQGEKFPGVGDEVDASLLERFLGVDAEIGVRYLDRLVEERLLERTPEGRFRMTEEGRKHGGRVFGEEFSELTRSAHGECGADCWCHADPDEAEACAAERIGSLHDLEHDHSHHHGDH
ncbi:MAG: hypothetical protein ABR575_00985 [Actinomycetota bacterium]